MTSHVSKVHANRKKNTLVALRLLIVISLPRQMNCFGGKTCYLQ